LVERISAWWTSRSIIAAATTSSPKILPQREKGFVRGEHHRRPPVARGDEREHQVGRLGVEVDNGSTKKTVQTAGVGGVEDPRDRKGSFEPKLLANRQTRLAGLYERILGLYGGGMSVRDIEQHLRDLYGVDVGRDTVSRVTDAVL
jgi:Transposase, Mutator family